MAEEASVEQVKQETEQTEEETEQLTATEEPAVKEEPAVTEEPDITEQQAAEPDEKAPEEKVSDSVEAGDNEYVCPPEFNTREDMRKLYVGRLHSDTTEDEFREYFATFAEVVDAAVIHKPDKNYGFVTFQNCDDVDELLLKRPLSLKDKELECKRAMPKEGNSNTAHLRTKKLFLAYVTPNMKEPEVREYLEKRHPSKYGTIDEISILKKKDDKGNETEENRGYGFITVSNEDFADRISIGEMRFNLGNGSRPQEIKKAEPKDRSGGPMRRGRGGGGGSWGMHGGRGGGGYSGYDAYGFGGYGGGYGYGSYPFHGYSGYDYYGYPAYGGGYGGRYQPY